MLLTVAPIGDEAGVETIELATPQFRVRDPMRDMMLGVGPTLGGKLFTIGSPNPAQWAPEIGARFVFGSWRLNMVARGAVAPLIPLPESIATSQSGYLLEGALALRVMPVLHRLVRFGVRAGVVFDRISSRVTLEDDAGGASGHKRVNHISPKIGLELAFPLVFARASRPWSLDLFLTHDLRLARATRSTLTVEDEAGESTTTHLPRELEVIGPFGGAMVSGRVGLSFHYDFVTARQSQSSASQ